MSRFALEMFATAHPMLRRLQWRIATNGQSDCENRQRDYQNKAARQRRGHDVEANTSRKRSNVGAAVFKRQSG
jgi:hypothetical protein